MKMVYFMRHAKTQRLAASDFDRVLTKRGFDDCAVMAGVLKHHNVATEMIYSSAAARTMQTAHLMAGELGGEVVGVGELYEASADGVLEFVGRIDERLNSVLIVGHNPAMWDIYDRLGGKKIDNLPTAAVFGVSVQWFAEILKGNIEWLKIASEYRGS